MVPKKGVVKIDTDEELQATNRGLETTVREPTAKLEKAKGELEDLVEKLRLMFESITDALIVADLKGNIVEVNEAALRVTGYDKEAFIGRNALDFIAEKDHARAMEALWSTLEEGRSIEGLEYTVLAADGSEFEAEFSGAVLHDSFGNPAGFIGIARDITERRRAEQELIRLSNAVRMSTDSIVISDLEANIVEVNEATLKMFGTDDKANLVGKNALELIAPEDRKKTLAARQEVLEKGYDENVEYHIITKDGSRILVEMSTAIMKGVDGKPTGFVAVSRDISERKRMEEALRESEHKYRILFESGLDGVAVIDAETLKVVLCNQAAAKTYGFDSAEDLIGINPLDFIHPDDRELALRIMVEDMFEKDLSQVNEFRTITKDGKEKWISAIGTVIEYQGKLAALASFSDITERKRAERIARERTIKLEKAKRELEETASRLRTLQAVTEAGLSQMELDKMLQELLNRFVQGIGSPFGIILLLDEQSGEFRAKAIRQPKGVELDLEELTVNVKDNLIGELLKSTTPVFLREEDFPSLPISNKLMKTLEDTRTKSLMAMPLTYRGKAIGLAGAGWGVSQDFTTQEIELLEIIADRAATAIEFHRLNEETRQKSAELEKKNLALEETASHLSTLQAITEVGLTRMGLDEMLQELLNRFLRGVRTSFGIIWLVDEEKGQLRTRPSLLAKGVELSAEDFTLDIRNPLFGALLTLTTPLLVEEKDFHNIPMNDRLKKALNDTQVKSLMLVPFTYQGKVIGIACCGWKKRREFTPQELGLLEVIADRAANAIEFHRLNEETRQKSVELRESEEKLRIMFESIGEGIVVSDLDANIVEVNEATLRMTKYSKKELIGRNSFDFIAKKDQAMAMEALGKAIAEGRSATLEYTLLAKDGGEFDSEASGALLCDSSGNPAGVISVIRDITERKQAEEELIRRKEALEETTQHLSTLQAITEVGLSQLGIDEMLQELLSRFTLGMRATSGIIWLLDEERGELRARASLLPPEPVISLEDLTLDVKESFIGEFIRSATPLFLGEKALANLPLSSKLKSAQEEDTQTKSALAVPLKYQGKVFGVIHCAWKESREFTQRDIELIEVVADRAANAIEFHRLNEESRRKSAELKESEEKLRTMFESIGEGIFILDLEGTIVEINEAALRMLGFSDKQELIGLNGFDFLAGENRAIAMDAVGKTLEQGRSIDSLEYTLRVADGRKITAEFSGAVLRDSCGNPAGLIGVMRDVTERKQAEETLRVKDSAISSSINAVALADLEGNLTYVNASFLKLWGCENEEEVMGKPAIEFWQMGEQAAAVMEAVFKKGGWQGELVASRTDRSTFDVQVSASMVTNEAGQPICLMSSFIDISERKRAEEALRESEERLRAFIENAPDAIYINDLTGTLLDGNRQAEELIGYSREEIIGKNFVEAGLLPEDYLPAALAGLEQNIRGEASGPDEFELITKDGSRVFVEIRTFPIARKGNVEVLGIARDITERKRAEEALKQSEERYRRFIEDINDAYVLVDIQEGNALFANARCAELLGYTVEEIIGQPLVKFVPPEAMQEVAEQFARVLEGEAPVAQYETEVIDKQGIRIPVEVSTKIIEHEGRIASSAIIRDITERKRAEEALRESEERYRTILEDIEDGYYEVDIAGNFTFFNDPMCGIIGYPRDEMIGMNNRQYMDKQNAKRVYQAFNRAFTTGIPSKEFGWEITRKDGAKRFIEASVSLIKNSKGEPIGFRGIVRDITERKRAEEEIRQKSVELEQKNIDLERASELKSEFLANMSHELRTPMNAIMGYTSLMRRERYGTVTEKQAEALERVDRNAKNLLSLINNILDISKIEAGKMPIHNEEVDLRELVDEVTTTVEPMVREAKLALETTMTGDIPALWTDRSKLKQTILNLLSNAVKFTPKGGITVSAWGSDGRVKVAVSDTGIGIREEDLKLIFEQFRQVDGSTTREQGGTGLGLPIAKKFAKLLGGDIEVESVYGQGSTFTITIPCVAPRQTPRDIPEPIAEVPAKPITAAKTILVIDDDPEIVALVRENLSDTDYEVVVALSGEEGIKMAADLQPFAITLDILMPHRDGWYVIHKLKNDPQTAHIPVIIMSIIEEKALAYSLGVADYIVKPIERDLLVTTLKRLERAGRKEALVVDDDPKVVNLLRDILEGEGYIVREALSGREAISKIETKPPDYLFLDIGMTEVNGFDVLSHVWEKTYGSEMIIVITSATELAPEKRDFLSKRASIVIEKSGLHTKEAVEALKLALIAAQANKGVQGNEAKDSGGRRQRR